MQTYRQIAWWYASGKEGKKPVNKWEKTHQNFKITGKLVFFSLLLHNKKKLPPKKTIQMHEAKTEISDKAKKRWILYFVAGYFFFLSFCVCSILI